MAVIKLQLDEAEDLDFHLLAIHTSLEDFRLAYFLNQKLALRLCKNPEEIRVTNKKGQAFFPRFSYEDTKNEVVWNLIANENESAFKTNANTQGLFAGNTFTAKDYLLPEYKKVHFLLKIDGSADQVLPNSVLSQLKTIDWVTTAYAIDPESLKSKNNLIF